MKKTNIQWCHSTVNPVMGCDGCELWPSALRLTELIMSALRRSCCRPSEEVAWNVVNVVGDRSTSEIYLDRERIAGQLCSMSSSRSQHYLRNEIIDTIRWECKCYAGMLGTFRAGHKGYADAFDVPKLHPGRMVTAASWGRPTEKEISDKPWLRGLPRLIFVSDMGDALSANIPFEYLHREIIRNVSSPCGQRHLWLWLSKRPARMAEFGLWLAKQGMAWPDNLVAMTTVTHQSFAQRIVELRKVPSKLKGLSLEPLFCRVNLDLHGIDWVIVGGGSDALASAFHVEWAMDLRKQCETEGIAFFLKQLGSFPWHQGQRVRLKDSHGADWNEWRQEWRVRELPETFSNRLPTTM